MYEIRAIYQTGFDKKQHAHYLIYDADSQRYVVKCYKRENAEAIIKILEEDADVLK